MPGRGTEEMKTNDVTGRYQPGWVAMNVEVGRPGTGTRLTEVQKVVRALAAKGVEFEPANPLTSLLANPRTGDMRPEVLNEKVLRRCPRQRPLGADADGPW